MAETENRPKTRKTRKTKEEIVEVDLNGEPAYSVIDSAAYLGLSPAGLQKILHQHPEIKKRSRGFGNERYILKKDLDELNRPRVVD